MQQSVMCSKFFCAAVLYVILYHFVCCCVLCGAVLIYVLQCTFIDLRAEASGTMLCYRHQLPSYRAVHETLVCKHYGFIQYYTLGFDGDPTLDL